MSWYKNYGYFCVFVIVLYKIRDIGVLEKMCVWNILGLINLVLFFLKFLFYFVYYLLCKIGNCKFIVIVYKVCNVLFLKGLI